MINPVTRMEIADIANVMRLSKVSPQTPLPEQLAFFGKLFCSIHKTDIRIKPCQDCLKLLDTLLKKYNILSDIEM